VIINTCGPGRRSLRLQ